MCAALGRGAHAVKVGGVRERPQDSWDPIPSTIYAESNPKRAEPLSVAVRLLLAGRQEPANGHINVGAQARGRPRQ